MAIGGIIIYNPQQILDGGNASTIKCKLYVQGDSGCIFCVNE